MHFSAWDAAGRRSVRIFSTFGHPLHLSHYMSIGFGMALGLASSTLSKGHRWLLVLIGLTAAFCNLFTSSVGGLLGMSGVVLTTMILHRRRRIVLFAPVLLVALLLVAPPVMMNKLGRVLTGQATSGAARMVTYTQAFEVVRDNPLLGVGWGGVRTALEHDYRETRADAVAFTAENYFLQRAVALGIPGFLLVVLLCILFFRNAILPRGQLPDPSWPRAAILTAGVAFYLQGQTFPTGYMSGILILWLLIASAERMRESVVRHVEGA
jgi:O-antigen ligase